MKYIFLLVMIMTVGACAGNPDGQKRGWFFGLFSPKHWPEEHWQGQNYQSNLHDPQFYLPAAVDRDHSMFDGKTVENTSPEEFIKNLKQAEIIEAVYSQRPGWFSKSCDTIDRTIDLQEYKNCIHKFPGSNINILVVDHNFYTLSWADQAVIANLINQSYTDKSFILRDKHTRKTIGQINDGQLMLF